MLIKTDINQFQSYLEDASLYGGGFAEKIYFPESTLDVRIALQEVLREKQTITISGAGTGLVGGRVSHQGCILSLEKILQTNVPEKLKRNKFKTINLSLPTGDSRLDLIRDNDEYSVWVSAAISLEEFQNVLDKEGLFYPPDPTEKKASLGGTLATNASGARSFKYGPTRNWVKTIRVVLAGGEVLDLSRGEYTARDGYINNFPFAGKKLKVPTYSMPKCKSSAGYFSGEKVDAIDLFIGSEGTLGIITEMELRILKKPKFFLTGICFFNNEMDAWRFVSQARAETGFFALEYFDKYSLEKLRLSNTKVNIPVDSEAAIFWEYLANESLAEEDVWGLLQNVMDNNISSAQKETELVKLFDFLKQFNVLEEMSFFVDDNTAHANFRHALPLRINEEIAENKRIAKADLYKIATDMAVDDDHLMEMMMYYEDVLTNQDVEYVVFGHIGSNHLHINFLPKNEKELHQSKEIYKEIAKKIVSMGGTISAEHGIGKTKKEFLPILYSENAIQDMIALKKQLDPYNLLNNGNIFDMIDSKS